MRLVLITCGLPGPAYHGGAVTCWAIVKAMLSRGHKATVLSLFDNSEANPYLNSKEIQAKSLHEIGAEVVFVEYNPKKLKKYNNPRGLISRTLTRANRFFNPPIEKHFPCAQLRSQVQEKLRGIKPDAIFCYHFDALGAAYNTNIAPIMAGVGDLWHLPSYFGLKAKKILPEKYLINYPLYLMFRNISKRLMLEMLRSCNKKGAFAAHYAGWLRNHEGFEDTFYLRTPAHDPVGNEWRRLKEEHKNKRNSEIPKILMIGDVAGTASRWGLRLLIKEVLPELEKRLGSNGFEIHLIGGGKIADEFKGLYEHPRIKIKGRIVPPDAEFLSSDILFVPTPITLGIRVRIITGFSYGSCVITHKANTAGIPEIKHQENALVADNGLGLAHEIVHALEDRNLRTRLEKNARMTFENYFSERIAGEKIVIELETMYENWRA